jgi:hypothetical protein
MAVLNSVKDGSGNTLFAVGDSHGRTLINDAWETLIQSEAAANDSDKTFTVPADYEYKLANAFITLVTTADAGNRQLVLEITDGTNVIAQFRVGVVQAASLTRYYNIGVGVQDLAAFRDTDYLSTQIPDLLLKAAYTVRIYDKAAIAAAADDMTVRLIWKTRQVS